MAFISIIVITPLCNTFKKLWKNYARFKARGIFDYLFDLKACGHSWPHPADGDHAS
jgi:hypothetical protein